MSCYFVTAQWFYHAKSVSSDLRHVVCLNSHFRLPREGLTVTLLPLYFSRWKFLQIKFANISRANYAFQVDWMYYLAFGAVVTGIVIYSMYVLLHFHIINLLFLLNFFFPEFFQNEWFQNWFSQFFDVIP
jgi:hypothetical protein